MIVKLQKEDGTIFNAIISDNNYEEFRKHLLAIELGEKLGLLKWSITSYTSQ